ncbi:hypothetical protein DFH06DRAFT_1338877 [Mycena polygramma]|nr:hypothetical protein DFH06DRAFT_1338877 [Mycena polygramma]
MSRRSESIEERTTIDETDATMDDPSDDEEDQYPSKSVYIDDSAEVDRDADMWDPSDEEDDDSDSEESRLRRQDEQDFNMRAIEAGHEARLQEAAPYRIPSPLLDAGAATRSQAERNDSRAPSPVERASSPTDQRPQPQLDIPPVAFQRPCDPTPLFLHDPSSHGPTPYDQRHYTPLWNISYERERSPGQGGSRRESARPSTPPPRLFFDNENTPAPSHPELTPSSPQPSLATRGSPSPPAERPEKRRRVEGEPSATGQRRARVKAFLDIDAEDSDEDQDEDEDEDEDLEETMSDKEYEQDLDEEVVAGSSYLLHPESSDPASTEYEIVKPGTWVRPKSGSRAQRVAFVLSTCTLYTIPDNKFKTIKFTSPIQCRTYPRVLPTGDQRSPFADSRLSALQKIVFDAPSPALAEGDRVVVVRGEQDGNVGYISAMRDILVKGRRMEYAKFVPHYDGTARVKKDDAGVYVRVGGLKRHGLDVCYDLRIHDRVKVVHGLLYWGATGCVENIEQDIVTVAVPTDYPVVGATFPSKWTDGRQSFTVNIGYLRRDIQLGDIVQVRRAEHQGRCGFVVALFRGGSLELYCGRSPDTDETAFDDEADQPNTLVVRAADVDFADDLSGMTVEYRGFQGPSGWESVPQTRTGQLEPASAVPPVTIQGPLSSALVQKVMREHAPNLPPPGSLLVAAEPTMQDTLRQHGSHALPTGQTLVDRHQVEMQRWKNANSLQEREQRQKTLQAELMYTGRRYEGFEVQVGNKHPMKGVRGTVVADYDSQKRVKRLQGKRRKQTEQWWDQQDIMVIVQKEASLARFDVDVKFLYHRETRIELTKARVMGVAGIQRILRQGKEKLEAQREVTPPYAPEVLERVVDESGGWGRGEDPELESQGKWLYIDALAKKHVDVELHGLKRLLGRISSTILSLEGTCCYLLLGAPVTDKDAKVQVFSCGRNNTKHMIAVNCIKPRRVNDEGIPLTKFQTMLKLSKKQRGVAAASSPVSYDLLPGPRAVHHRRKIPPHIARRPDILLYNGETLIQPRLPPLLGQSAFSYQAVDGSPSRTPRTSEADRVAEEFAEGASQDPDIMPVRGTPPPDPGRHRRKKAAQWQRWQQEVLPALLPHYATLLYDTKSLRKVDGRMPPSSTCHCTTTKLHKVAIVRFSSIEDVELHVCQCSSAAIQLIQLGTFGCAPILPSLAVDLRVLEFTMNLFLQISPNNTALTIALERALAAMGFQLEHQNSLRRRFGNCLMWYTHLRKLLTQRYDRLIETRSSSRTRGSSSTPTPSSPQTRRRQRSSSSSSSSDGSPTPTGSSRKRKRDTAEHPQVPFPEPPPRTRPSEYLRRRCPACFGNLVYDPSEVADFVACLDACFTQKHKKCPRDPPRFHPNTRFVPEDVAARMEAYVDEVRRTAPKKTTKRPRVHRVEEEEEEEDGYEHDKLPLPRSVLDGCEASFKAADEKREKASTEFFDDTVLMALVCRHDRVLWVVNMHSAGEKQFNVLLLVETLFQHLPPKVRVGLLYDIACTLERSCLKWGFLSRWLDRIAFAVSVFHAFGHEWACQLLYHPRKRVGFGFSNGEGCERFWKLISHLITHLRIVGYHNRLYTLNAQIEHTDETSLLRLGEWVRRRHAHSTAKRADATKVFRESGIPIPDLRAHWKEQVMAQTRPLPRRSKKRGEQAVNAVMLLQAAIKTRKAILDLQTARDALDKMESTLRRKEAALGVSDAEELANLAGSEYLRVRMNTRALKLRLRERLRARKFEMDVVERAYRRLMNDAKLHAHTASAVKRREPTISKIAADYNKLCTEITKLINDGKAPHGAIAPLQIPAKGLWQLDVDNIIFQDAGLDDSVDNDDEPPAWLSDEKVRAGIKALLELDRCDEEDARLRREKVALRTWFAEEWDIATRAFDQAESAVDRYHLQLQLDKLVKLCATWDRYLPHFGVDEPAMPPWGPSASQLSKCDVDAHMAARGEDRHYEEELEADDDDEVESGGEDDDFGTLEAVERADIYRNDY